MFDLNAEDEEGNTLYLIAGQTAKIHFNSGNLAGYEFDVHSYNHDTHTFVLKQFEDERGDLFPSETSSAFQIAVGDQYKILGVALPQSYIDDAEDKLEEDGLEYFNQNKQPKVKYALSIDKNFFEALAGESQSTQIIKPGDWLHIIDSDIDVDKSIRIVSLTRQLFDEYNYTLEVSDTVANATIINNIISDIIDINNVIQINNLNNPARARANWRSSREVLDMVFDPEGDYYTEKIKPNSIDTLCLAVGAKSMQFGLIGVTFKPNYNGNANSIQVTAGTLVHYTIDENAARTWNVAATSVTFSDSNAAYYIYAKCAKSGTGCIIVFTTTQQQVDGGLFYYFFIGIVNSVDPGLNARSVSLMYGFTMINGRFIQTGRICSSGGGATYFDLDAGEIGGKITLLSGSSGYNNLSDIPDLSHFLSDTDGLIEIWYKTVAPTTSNTPASGWNTVALKKAHVGDLYRFLSDTPVQQEGEGEQGRASARWYRWESYNTIQRIDDEDVSVIEWHWVEVTPVPDWFNNIVPSPLPSTSQKMFSFVTPTPPYSVGDIWLNGGVFMKCLTERTASDSFVMSDWDDSGIYDNTQTIIDGGIITSGTIRLAGRGGEIKAGVTGNGTNANSVRMWAGDTFDNRANAPFRVLQNGKMVATGSEVIDSLIKGTVRSPFQNGDSNAFSSLKYDNIITTSGHSVNLVWDTTQSGRRIMVCGSGTIIAPSGSNQYIYYDGSRKTTSLTYNNEMLTLIGYGTTETFYGWIIVDRDTFYGNSETYGHSLKALMMGVVSLASISGGIRIKLRGAVFDDTTISSIGFSNGGSVGRYKISLPASWFTVNGSVVLDNILVIGSACEDSATVALRGKSYNSNSNKVELVISSALVGGTPCWTTFNFIIYNGNQWQNSQQIGDFDYANY